MISNKGTIRLSRKQRKRRENAIYMAKNFRNEPLFVLCAGPAEVFYKSSEWASFRFEFLKTNKRVCALCGQGPNQGIQIQLDHIKPRYIYPELALDVKNIQILCAPCNRGKGLQEFKVKTIRRQT